MTREGIPMKAIICGAGISGLAAAAFLAGDGWDVVVVEQAAGPRPQGYMVDFFGPGWQAATALGIIPRIRELGYRVERLDYVDGRGRARASLPFARFAQVVRGELVSILRPDLELAIREAVPPGVDLRYGRTVLAVGQGRASVTAMLDDGASLEADLLIGADGIHSVIRELVFGPEPEFLHYLGFHVGAYSFRDPEVASLVGDRFAVTDTRNEAMFFYRLRDGTITAMAVHRTDDPARPDDPQACSAPGTGGWSGSARQPSATARRTSTTTRSPRSECPAGTRDAPSWSVMRQPRCHCSPAMEPPSEWPPPMCWRMN